MAYSGSQIPIPLGQLGLRTDDAQTSLPANAMIKANNITMFAGRVEKSHGTTKYNATALTDAVVSVFDWYPTPNLQRLIAVTADGKIWRDTGDSTFSSNTPIKDLATTLSTDVHQVTGGAEEAGRNKKLFIFTGNKQIQVLEGDGSTTTDIDLPSPDWASSNFPTFGIQYQNRLCVLGSAGNRHTAYFSFEDDHENFQGVASNPQFANAAWDIWQLLAAGDVDQTANMQSGANVNIFNTINGDGFMVQATGKFNKVTFTQVNSATGSPVFDYSYWTGVNWSPLTLTTTPNYTTTGAKTIAFDIPANWNVGDGVEGGDNTRYSIRIIASTAPSAAVAANSMAVFNTTFDTFPPQFPIFPGEGEGLLCAAVYRGLLFLFKEPFGVYIIDGTDPNPDNWTIQRYSSSFGVASPHSVLQVLTDLIAANSFGSYTSLQASNAFGDFEAGDILANAAVENYIRGQFNSAGLDTSQCIYYPEKKLAMFTGNSTSSSGADRILMIDVGKENSRISIETKEKPNCLALRKDASRIQRPMYGAVNGHVYLMDQATYSVDGQAFLGEFQTPYTDLSFASHELGGKNKIFDFLEVNYISPGNYSFFVDVYVDGEFRLTVEYPMTAGAALDSFVLDTNRLAGDEAGNSNRKPLKSCTGKRISFRFYNNFVNQAFKIERIILSFRVSSEQLYSYQT